MSEIKYTGDEMTDYQFKRYEELRDKCEALERENARLRGERPVHDDGNGLTDFQYKNLIEMIYQILKANFEAGKTPEEVLAIIAALKNEPKDKGQG